MNKGIIYAVIGTVLIGGGIGAYLYFRKKKNTNELKDSDATNVVDEQTTDNDDKNVADIKVNDDKPFNLVSVDCVYALNEEVFNFWLI